MTKLCKCHDQPMFWDGFQWRCRSNRLASRRRYNNSDKGWATYVRFKESPKYRIDQLRRSCEARAERIAEIKEELNNSPLQTEDRG